MAEIGLASFMGSRCRLTRLSDGKTFTGWVEHFDGGCIAVASDVPFDLGIGEAVYAELFGDYVTACMTVDTTACQPVRRSSGGVSKMEWLDGQLTAQRTEGDVTSRIRVVESTGARRQIVQNWEVKIHRSGEQTRGTVHDVSSGGLGIDVETPIESGDEVELRIQTPVGEIRCRARVLYCRELQSGSEMYRCGVRIENMPRVDYARWARLTLEAA